MLESATTSARTVAPLGAPVARGPRECHLCCGPTPYDCRSAGGLHADALVGTFESRYRLERAIEIALIGPAAGEGSGDRDCVGGGKFCAEEGPGECCVPPEEAGGEDAASGRDDAVVVEGEVAVFVEAAPLRRGGRVRGDV